MQGSTFLAAELARIAWCEGGSEGLNGQLAVAFTIRNRVRAGWYSGDWASVLSHHKEWSATLEPLPTTVPDPRSHAFGMLLREIDDIFTGTREDNVTVYAGPDAFRSVVSIGPAARPVLYYGRLDTVTNDWFLTEICRKPELHPRLAQVGLLFFFG